MSAIDPSPCPFHARVITATVSLKKTFTRSPSPVLHFAAWIGATFRVLCLIRAKAAAAESHTRGRKCRVVGRLKRGLWLVRV
jgi:hypothetical protein